MRGHSLKVRTELFNKKDCKYELIPKTFYRQAVYQAVRIIDQQIGMFKCLGKMVGEDDKIDTVSLRKFEVELSVVDDQAIHKLNKEFRQVDSPTDVLSFPAWEDESALLVYPDVHLYLGEIVISLDTALRQAQEDNVSLRHMTAWLIAHAILHLVGFDHPDNETRRIMRDHELTIVKAMGFTSIPKMANEAYASK
ncbi:MAG: rRNA maturation RNase YbeY [Candidatus Bruticola sp.]